METENIILLVIGGGLALMAGLAVYEMVGRKQWHRWH